MMKRLSLLLIIFISALLITAPVHAAPGALDGPPGWSYENPGQGGVDKPGKGG